MQGGRSLPFMHAKEEIMHNMAGTAGSRSSRAQQAQQAYQAQPAGTAHLNGPILEQRCNDQGLQPIFMLPPLKHPCTANSFPIWAQPCLSSALQSPERMDTGSQEQEGSQKYAGG